MEHNPVDLDVIPSMVWNEDPSELSSQGVANNDLISDDDAKDIDQMLEQDDDGEHEHVNFDETPIAPPQMGVGPSSFDQGQIPIEFYDGSWSLEGVSSQWVQQQVQTNLYETGPLFIGAQFASKGELMHAIKSFHLEAQAQYRIAHSDAGRVMLKCRVGGSCKWKLTASKPDGYDVWRIVRVQGTHTCVNQINSRDHRQLDSPFIAEFIRETVKSQLNTTAKSIITQIRQKYHYTISYKKAWLGKQLAISQIFGSCDESYRILPEFIAAMEASNPGTIVEWQTGNSIHPGVHVFERVFWAFGPAIEAFRYCRPVLCVDGTHLYGRYKGKLLIAVGIDGNRQLLPLAYAITEGETNDTWAWFMGILCRRVTNRVGLTVISDRHIGIINAMQDPDLGWREPYAFHRYCIRHYCSNFNTEFKNKALKNAFYSLAVETEERRFVKLWERIQGFENGAAAAWLTQIPFEKWTLLHDQGRRWGDMTTNMVEVFNSALKGARALPITALVQLTYYRTNALFCDHRMDGVARLSTGALHTTSIDATLVGLSQKAGSYDVVMFHDRPGVFEVSFRTNRYRGSTTPRQSHAVDLGNMTCTCNKWQFYHYPCSHTIAACASRSYDPYDLVDDVYKIQTYVNCWAPTFHPIPDRSTWPRYDGPTVIPDPTMRRSKKGRPCSTRIHNEMDSREGDLAAVTCGICHTIGHNRRSCPSRQQ